MHPTFALKYKCMMMGWLGSRVLVHLWCYVQAGRLQNGKTCRDVCPRKRERKNQNKNPLIVPLCAGWEAGKGQLRAWPPTDQTHFLTWPLCPLPNYIPIKAAPDCKQVVKEPKSEDKISKIIWNYKNIEEECISCPLAKPFPSRCWGLWTMR